MIDMPIHEKNVVNDLHILDYMISSIYLFNLISPGKIVSWLKQEIPDKCTSRRRNFKNRQKTLFC